MLAAMWMPSIMRSLFGVSEKTEDGLSVGARFFEGGMIAEVDGFVMFDDHDAAGRQIAVAEGEIHEFFEVSGGKFIGRIGENEIEGFGGGDFQEAIDVVEDGLDGHVELCGGFPDESDAGGMFVHGYDARGSARGQFVGDVAGAGKEVEGGDFVEEELVGQGIEEGFLGDVGGGTRGKIFGRVNFSAFVFAADDSHFR